MTKTDKENKTSKVSNLNKNDFINIIAEKSNITKAEAARIIDYFTKGIEEVIATGKKLTIIGFGSFYIAENKAKEGRNPKTGETIKIAASKTPKFKAGVDLKKLCNK
jgi:DNA-binding protein HU-beta